MAANHGAGSRAVVAATAAAAAAAAAAAKRVQIEKAHNFMRQYRDPESRELKKLSANQFMDVWAHYDKDGNGYIEGTELDGFLREFVASANATDVSPEAVTDTMLEELKSCFMEAYDDNQDGKIDIREIWREYDTDNSGYIEADELKNFLRDLLKEAKKINDVSEDKLIEYTDTMCPTLSLYLWNAAVLSLCEGIKHPGGFEIEQPFIISIDSESFSKSI
uniref:EF-hand domain-containing protein n=1 Tax=Glossina morsitans morsitans TaxID=37546 RepID=A0A1B0FCJ0_GLOMM